MKYVKGQKVKIIGGVGTEPWSRFSECLGKTGIITSYGDAPYHLDDNKWMINFKEEWLEPIEEDYKPKIGDMVRVTECGYGMVAHVGIIGRLKQIHAPGVNYKKASYYLDHPNGCSATEIEPIEDSESIGGMARSTYPELGTSLTLESLKIMYDEASHFDSPQQQSGGESEVKNMAFKIGDRVTVDEGACVCNIEETEYIVKSRDGYILYISDTCSSECECTCYSLWTLISHAENTMAVINTLTKNQKESWTKDQQALYRVGIMDSNGEITSQMQTLIALVKVNQKALVANAEAEIAEMEAELEKAKKSK